MELFVFSSTTLTNVWAGIGARKWAVSPNQAANPSVAGRARTLQIGSIGILYCVETQSLTTPFIVASVPDETATITNIWPRDEKWELPFDIYPLGSPEKQMGKNEIANLPVVKDSGRQWNNVIRTQGQFAFQAAIIGAEDWSIIFQQLSSH
ncbi:MAG TPA: hypothetical protein VJT71_02265 [Pyrinomonadaceae bacterium]|nr:hypothetical protein [Pyrinomonadaceae bacterium]